MGSLAYKICHFYNHDDIKMAVQKNSVKFRILLKHDRSSSHKDNSIRARVWSTMGNEQGVVNDARRSRMMDFQLLNNVEEIG